MGHIKIETYEREEKKIPTSIVCTDFTGVMNMHSSRACPALLESPVCCYVERREKKIQ